MRASRPGKDKNASMHSHSAKSKDHLPDEERSFSKNTASSPPAVPNHHVGVSMDMSSRSEVQYKGSENKPSNALEDQSSSETNWDDLSFSALTMNQQDFDSRFSSATEGFSMAVDHNHPTRRCSPWSEVDIAIDTASGEKDRRGYYKAKTELPAAAVAPEERENSDKQESTVCPTAAERIRRRLSSLWVRPPAPGKTRLKWQCTCGLIIQDDFIEMKPHGIERYKQALSAHQVSHIRHSAGTESNRRDLTCCADSNPAWRRLLLLVFVVTLALCLTTLICVAMVYGAKKLRSALFHSSEKESLHSPWINLSAKQAILVGASCLLVFLTRQYLSRIPTRGRRGENGELNDVNEIQELQNGRRPGSSVSAKVQWLYSFISRRNGETTNDISLYRRPFAPTFPNDNRTDPRTIATRAELLFLLVCLGEGRFATRLLQLNLVKNQALGDRSLFKLLRCTYQSRKRRWLSKLSLRSLLWIKFVHFQLHPDELVDVRKEDSMPPPEIPDYKYDPVPLDVVPPIGDRHMMHLYHHPECASAIPFCVPRFPKKRTEELRWCHTKGLNPGWGLEFVEGWDMRKIWIIVFVVLCLGSLLVGIMLTVCGKSLQDAFAVAAYMVTMATVTIGFVQALLM